MGLYTEFEHQYSVLTAEITSNIGKLKNSNDENRSHLITEINKGLEEANELLEQLNLEIREEPDPNTRLKCQTRCNSYQAELKRLQQEYNQTKSRNFQTLDLDYDDIEENLGIQEDQKRRLLNNSERIEITGKHLEDGYRIAVETEQISTQVLTNLAQQRESIQKSRSRLRETNAELNRSSRLMNTMIMRVFREKAILYGIIGISVIVISLTIYFKMSQ